MNNLDTIFNESDMDGAIYTEKYFEYLKSVLDKIDRKAMSDFLNFLVELREKEATLFVIGNGGSAATSSHIANDLAIGLRLENKPMKCMSLTDNNAVMTAIGNDFGYDDLFIAQLKNFLKPGDALLAISASGNSPNVIKACELAKDLKISVLSFTGFDGGKLKVLSDINLHVPTQKGEYGPVEDVHMVFDHLIGSYLYRFFRKK